jgi:predicted N-acetyltransferase YhbS
VAIVIRPARPDDAPALQEIERLAGEAFRDIGMPEIADSAPLPIDELARSAAEGRSWVALDDAQTPIGYVLVEHVDGNSHIEQVSVRPDHQRAGVGRALVDCVCDRAARSGLPAVTLTTFSNVEWNAPLYRRLGFRVLAEDEIGPELLAVRDTETAHGLDPERRVCMRRELTE